MLSTRYAGSTSELMDFTQFLVWCRDARHQTPGAESHCETRIGRALSGLLPVIRTEAPPLRTHRCDLVTRWCQVAGLDASTHTTLASEGVRHSLQVIFGLLARAGETVAIPTDVYPVYLQLATKSGLSTVGVATFPSFELERILDIAAKAGARYVLLPQPLKLHGRSWTDDEIAVAEAWLRSDGRRRLMVDGAYRLGQRLSTACQRLIETDQVVFLDSLSKGWLHEQIFGVAVIPKRDITIYASPFRNLLPTPSKLFVAKQLLDEFADTPFKVARELETLRQNLLTRVRLTKHKSLPAQSGYFVPVECPTQQMLEQQGMLTIPASVFGSRLSGWSVASALPAAEAHS
jgi:aspartate/methionine/tyrosine aminotransferase